MRKKIHVIAIFVMLAGIAGSAMILRVTIQPSSAAGSGMINITCPGSERIWDGGGSTNNWSEAANWCSDQLPISGSVVQFDGTSSKDALVDSNVSVTTLKILPAYSGTLSVADLNSIAAGNIEQASGSVSIGTGSLSVAGSYTMTGGSFNGGSGSLTTGFISPSGGTFDVGGAVHNAANIVMGGGHIVFTSGTMTITGSFFRSAGTGDFDNGTIIAAGGLNQSLDGIYGSVNNLTVNKPDSLGISSVGTVAVLGTLSLIDGIYGGSGTLEARGPVVIESTFGNSTGGGGGTIALRNGAGPRTVTLPAGSKLPALVIDDPQVSVNTDGPGTVNLDDVTLSAGTVEIGNTDLIFGYTTAVSGSQYIQTGGTFNITTGNVVWNTAGNFSLSNGTFNAGSGTVALGGGQFSLSGGTFTPSTGSNTFGLSLNTSFNQSGGLFASGAGSVDVNGAFNLSGGTFNAPSGNMSVGFNFDHTAGTFNHNEGTLIFDSSHPAFGHNLPGNPGTGQFHNLVFALTTENASLTLGGDTWVASGDITVSNGQIGFGILRPEGNFTVESGADGGNAEVRFSGTAAQAFQNNGGVNPTGTFSVDKPTGTVTAASDMLLGTSQALNIVSGALYLADGSDLRSGNLTIGTSGRLVNDSSTTITLGGNVSNSGRIDLQGGGADCPGDDLILIRSSVSGTQRQWNGSGAFRLVDTDIQDMAGSAAITAFSSTNSGNVGANWTFDGGCPASLSISPETVSLYRNQTQTFTAGGGFAPRTFSFVQNNSGGSINSSNGLYTAGNTMNVTDTIRVTDAFGSTADATVNVIPGPPTRLVFSVQPSNGSAGQAISPAIQVAVQDNNGNTIPNATNAVTLNLLDNPGGSTLSGTITRNAVNGIATFNDISLNKVGNGYTFTAGSNGLSGALSEAFNIAAGAPAQLVYDQQPTNVYPGTTIQPSVRVAVLDAFGNLASNATIPVTITIETNPNGGTLVNGGPQNTINGYATFSCRIEGALNFGSGYTLMATSPGLPTATSQSFDVLSPFIVVNTNNSGSGSLRSAVGSANATPGHQIISFNIPGAPPYTINYVGVGDPITITDSVTIDGTTQPSYPGSPVIEINGSQYTAINATALVSQSPNNTIKGLAFTGFSSTALRIASSNNIIIGNYFGLSPLGISAGNHTGISVGSSGNLIGGSDPMDRNVITGNNVGISFFSGNQNNIVKGNLIGTAPDGIAPMPNLVGIWMTSGQNNIIGGTSFGDGNKIAFNTQDGIRINAASARVNGNSIHSNNGPGIDLQPLGVNGNDNCDADTGPNGKQNFPVISSVNLVGGGAQIEASLNSTPNQTFTIDYYANPVADPAGYGEGKTWIGSQSVTTGSNCSTGTFTFNAPSVPADTTNITATATDSEGRTSEFSQARGALISIAGTVRKGSNDPVSGVAVQLRNTISSPIIRTAVTDSAGRFVLTGLNPGSDYFVSMTKANHTFSPPTRTYTALTTAVDDNYTANVNYLTISGKVSTNGVGVSGVTVTLSGTASRTATTDSAGNYAFSNLLAGIYTVTPSRTGFTFTPGSSTQAVSNNTTFNFAAANQITGKILHSNGGELRTMNADGSGVVTLATNGSPNNISHSDLSRDGSKVAFVDQADGVFTMNYDGSGKTKIRTLPDGIFIQGLKWSPDKSRLGTTCQQASIKVCALNSSSGTLTQYSGPTPEVFYNWSGNNSLLLRRFASGGDQLYRLDLANNNRQLLVNRGVYDAEESSDASLLAFRDASGIWKANIDGSGQQQTPNLSGTGQFRLSPTGLRILSTEYTSGFVMRSYDLSTGTGQFEHGPGGHRSWANYYSQPVIAGTGVNAAVGNVSIQFGGIPFTTDGSSEVSFDAIAPESLGDAPSGYRFTQTGYELDITGTFTPPATVCITIPAERYGASAQFQRLRLLHFTGGSFVDITSLPNNEAVRTICGDASSLGGFAVAELIDPAMPSIAGQVVDENGEPIADHLVVLKGDDERMTRTDHEGLFAFTNLNTGGGYSVAPNQHGYLFDISSAGFDDISGENTVVFRGLAAQFTVSGSVRMGDGTPLAGVEVTMSGDGEQTTTTDPNGEYSFANAAANSSFEITARTAGGTPTPVSIFVARISSDLIGQDFVLFSPTAASVSIGGRVFAPDGRALRNATITATAPDGTVRTAVTGSFGYFRIEGLAAGSNYAVTVSSRAFIFDSVFVYADSDRDDLVFNGRPR
ncbi:MAG: carboxypeptidase regulatory-like domain-containing protein [Acidobacteriota bacterium]|nr:MAG: carboxypeptidase regulatory-like domain-containing protein [Acidobacteriota bacterium]